MLGLGAFAASSAFHTSAAAGSRFPSLYVRLTRRARIRFLRRQNKLKQELGPKYRQLKHIPPLNPPPVREPPMPIAPFLASRQQNLLVPASIARHGPLSSFLDKEKSSMEKSSMEMSSMEKSSMEKSSMEKSSTTAPVQEKISTVAIKLRGDSTARSGQNQRVSKMTVADTPGISLEEATAAREASMSISPDCIPARPNTRIRDVKLRDGVSLRSRPAAASDSVDHEAEKRLDEHIGTSPHQRLSGEDKASVLDVQLSAPYVAHGVTPEEAYLILKKAPETLKTSSSSALSRQRPSTGDDSRLGQPNITILEGLRGADEPPITPETQAEMVRRIISLENASASASRAWNKARIKGMLGKHAMDSGSSAVQAGLFTLKIQSMQEHLEQCRGKDVSTKRALVAWISKRMKILKYLRRKNIKEFVQTCEVIGVDPDTIRV